MTERKWGCIRGALVVPLLIALAPGSVVADDAAEIARLRERVARLEAENAELRVLAGLEPAPGAEAASAARLATVYDEARGLTSVTGRTTRLEVLEGVNGRHWMRLHYEHPGREPAAVERIVLELEAASFGEAYRNARSLGLAIDGATEAEECRVVSYRATPTLAGSGQRRVGTREVIAVEVPRATLGRVAGAREVRGSIGPTRFRLTPEQIVEFRVFQRRLDG